MVGKVLVVDDEDTLRLTIKTRLSTGGFEVDDATDGEEALEKMKQIPFDVVLLDINMPRMDGITALGLIADMYPKTDVIMLTGFADFSTAIECLKKGAKDYLVKPIDTTELITRMRSLQRARSSEAALEEAQSAHAGFLLDEVLSRIIGIQEAARMLADSGKLGKEQKTLTDVLVELSTQTVTEIRKNIDPKFLKPRSVALSIKSVAVEKLAENATNGLSDSAKTKGVTIEGLKAKGAMKIEADGPRLERAIRQITSALLDVSSKGATVTVEIGQEKGKDDLVSVSVSSSKANEKSVKALDQAGKSYDALGSNLSKLENPAALLLGARRTIDAHGGELRIESGKGAVTVSCTLPAKHKK